MAIAYLNEGATSDAAANWSDATGFAAAATLVVNTDTAQVISGGLDHSANSIASLDIRWPFRGSYGSEAAGPCIFDADGGSPNTVNYDARAGKFFVKAGGNNTLITTFNHTSPGSVYAYGGIFTTFGQQRGTSNFNGACTITTFGITGGSATLDTVSTGAASTLIELLQAPGVSNGGASVRLKRDTTTLNIDAGGCVKEDGTGTTTTVNMRGGYLEWWVGTITTLNYYGGDVNLANITRDVTLTNFNVYPGANPSVVRSIAATLTATPVYKYGGPTVRSSLPRAL